MNVEVYEGSRTGRRPTDGRHAPHVVKLAVLWEQSVVTARTMDAIAEAHPDAKARAKLRVLGAFARAWASRLLARLSACGRGPLLVPRQVDEVLPEEVHRRLLSEADFAQQLAGVFEAVAAESRPKADLSSAWVCELCRTEALDMSRELTSLALAEAVAKGKALVQEELTL